jgi:hypothetical protein
MKKILYSLLFLAPLSLWAQEETGDEVKSVEIRVVEDYQAQVRAAHKISEQPSFKDTTSDKIPVLVRIQPKGMSIDFQPAPIPAIKLGRVKLPKLPTQRVSVGGGMYSSSFADVVFSSPRSRKNVWGVKVHHEGARSGVFNTAYALQPSYENSVLTDFQRATKNYNFKTQLVLDGNYASLYGIQDTAAWFLSPTPHVWNLRAGVSQQWLRTSNPTSKVPAAYRSGGVAYQFTNAGIGAHEHLAKTMHRIEVYADEAQINVDLGYQFGQYSLTEMVYETRTNQYHHFYMSPQTHGKNGMLNYQFGLTFAGTINDEGAGQQGTYYIFPNINLQAEVLKRTLAVYGGWDGRAQQQTLSSLLANVPVISGDQALALTGENRGYVGMQGALAGKLQYRVEGSLAFVMNDVQFERDSTTSTINDMAALRVGYANYTRSRLRAELNLPMDVFTASVYTELNAYAGADEFIGAEGRVLGALLRVDQGDVHLTSNFKYVGGRYAGTSEKGIYELGDYMDVSLDLGYTINENLGVSLRAYNLLNQRYQLWSGYEVRRTRGLFVLNYQF